MPASRDYPFLRSSLLIAGAACVAWYFFVSMQAGVVEVLRMLAGVIALWLPLAALFGVLLRGVCTDPLSRFTLSALASYALTAPLYFACALIGHWVPGFEVAFYLLQAGIVAGVGIHVWRNCGQTPSTGLLAFVKRLDGPLVLLIALSFLVTARYKNVYGVMPDHVTPCFIASGDQTYYTALAYELARRTPAEQQPGRAGLKERAYHMFPHLTTMLVARYTAQPDMLRAHLFYEFTAIEMLICLAVYCIVRRMASDSPWAGYLGVSLVYILAIPLPALGDSTLGYFYCTLHPHATSTLEPAMITSTQMYSGVVVVLTILLATLQLSIGLAGHQRVGMLAIVAALASAALMQFRIQAFLPLFPGLLLLLGFAWYRTRERAVLWAMALGLLIVAGESLQMQLPIYYPQTARLKIGNNHLAEQILFFSSWPGAQPVHDVLHRWAPGVTAERRIWQLVCMTMFAIMNIVGPLGVTATVVHLCRRGVWRSQTALATAARGLAHRDVDSGIHVPGHDLRQLLGRRPNGVHDRLVYPPLAGGRALAGRCACA